MSKSRLPTLSAPVTIYLLCNLLAMALGALFVQWGGGKSPNQYLVGAGLSVMAAGVTGIVMVGYIIFSENTRNRITVLRDFGIREYFDANTTPIKGEYQRRLDTAKKRIDVLGLGLSHLRSDFEPVFEEWAKRGTVRVLLLDPNAPNGGLGSPASATTYAAQRDREERTAIGSIANEVEEWLRETADLRHRVPTFCVRLSKAIPTITMVRMDDEIFWSPYLMYRRSASTPTMVVRRGGLLYDVLSKHFDDIWNSPELSTDAPDAAANMRSTDAPDAAANK